MNLFIKRSERLFYLFVTIFFSFSACDIVNPPEDRVVIIVKDRKITTQDLKDDIKHLTAGMGISDQGIRHVINPLINKIVDHYILMEYGKEKGITISENELESEIKDIKKDYQEKDFEEMLLHQYVDYEEWRKGLRQQLLIKKILKEVSDRISPVTFHELKTYFDTHQDEFLRSEMVKFRQIVTLSREEAEKILKRLKDGEDMDELGRKTSIAPMLGTDGEEGWIARGDLEESMEKVIFSLPLGKISPVVKTPYGYHIIKVIEKGSGGFKSLPEAMKEIETKLFLQKKELLFSNWLKELRGIFSVQINQEVLKTMEFG